MDVLFITTKNNLDLVTAEIETVCSCNLTEIETGIYKTTLPSIPKANRFGFVKEIYEIKKTLSPENYISEITDNDISNSYKLNLLTKNNNQSIKEVADKLHARLLHPQVNLKNPDHEYAFLFLKKETLLLELLDRNTDQPQERKAHKKIHNHPTSLDPRLAKALINLTGTQTFHDPFCGTGGIVIEGALQGLRATGSDIAPGLIEKAKENAQAYDLHIDFSVKDALQLKNKTPAIVTDLPYGRNSLLTNEINELYTTFFEHTQHITNTLIVGMMSGTDIEKQLQNTKWIIEKEFTIYVHKSLSRKFLVLKKL